MGVYFPKIDFMFHISITKQLTVYLCVAEYFEIIYGDLRLFRFEISKTNDSISTNSWNILGYLADVGMYFFTSKLILLTSICATKHMQVFQTNSNKLRLLSYSFRFTWYNIISHSFRYPNLNKENEPDNLFVNYRTEDNWDKSRSCP